MKNKKIIGILVIILIICAVAFGIFKATHNENYLYNPDGTISDGHQDLLERLKNVSEAEERQKQIDFCLEQNLITQEEADRLY